MGTKVNFGLNLGMIKFEVEDIQYYFGKKTNNVAGPFLIIERLHGLAIETNEKATAGCQPSLNYIHGGKKQQWLLRKDLECQEEMHIISVANGMAFDKTTDSKDHAPLLLWENHNGVWQRWRIKELLNNKSNYFHCFRSFFFCGDIV